MPTVVYRDLIDHGGSPGKKFPDLDAAITREALSRRGAVEIEVLRGNRWGSVTLAEMTDEFIQAHVDGSLRQVEDIDQASARLCELLASALSAEAARIRMLVAARTARLD